MDDYTRHTAKIAATTIQPQVTSLCGKVLCDAEDEDRPHDGFPLAIFPAHCSSTCHLQGPQEPRAQRASTDPEGRSPHHCGHVFDPCKLVSLTATMDKITVDDNTVMHSNQSSSLPFWQAPSNESFDTRDRMQWDETSYTGAAIGGIPVIPYTEDIFKGVDTAESVWNPLNTTVAMDMD
jgi:hypothetical protein